MAARTAYLEQNADGSGFTDDRCIMAYAPNILANHLRSYPHIDDSERERLYQLAMDTPEICAALDNLVRVLGLAWREEN